MIGPAYVHHVLFFLCCSSYLRGSETWGRGSGQKVEVGRGKLQGRREAQAEITNHCLSFDWVQGTASSCDFQMWAQIDLHGKRFNQPLARNTMLHKTG